DLVGWHDRGEGSFRRGGVSRAPVDQREECAEGKIPLEGLHADKLGHDRLHPPPPLRQHQAKHDPKLCQALEEVAEDNDGGKIALAADESAHQGPGPSLVLTTSMMSIRDIGG